jgi:hypothetical protein
MVIEAALNSVTKNFLQNQMDQRFIRFIIPSDLAPIFNSAEVEGHLEFLYKVITESTMFRSPEQWKKALTLLPPDADYSGCSAFYCTRFYIYPNQIRRAVWHVSDRKRSTSTT